MPMSASARTPGTRHQRRQETLAEHRVDRDQGRSGAGPGTSRVRTGLFGAVIVSVLLIGGYLAFGDLVFGQRGATTNGAISVQASMAGFTPSVINVKAGQAVTLDWWTTDAPMHLTNGVHTMVSPELGLNEQLRGTSTSGESRTLVHFTAPMAPGTYDIVCESCCGGGANPAMHGKIVVDA
jgi:plastocyanin